MSHAQILKSSVLFSGFSDTGLILIGKICRERNIPAKTPIFVENMVAESLFIIKAGVVNLRLKSSSGEELKLDKLAPGDFFGELSLLIGGHRQVSAYAETDCELLEIPRRDFAKLQKQKPQTCLKLMINIVKQFGKKASAASEHLKSLVLSQLK